MPVHKLIRPIVPTRTRRLIGNRLFVATVLLAAVSTLAPLTLAPPVASSVPLHDDEFIGPFPSWGNKKTVSGAVDNGEDDTAAIQLVYNDIAH